MRIYLHTVDYTTFAEIHHRYEVTNRWYTRCESDSQTNSPGSRIKRSEDREYRTLLPDQLVPRACLHHVKALVEGKLAHGVESEPHHHVVKRDGSCSVTSNNFLSAGIVLLRLLAVRDRRSGLSLSDYLVCLAILCETGFLVVAGMQQVRCLRALCWH